MFKPSQEEVARIKQMHEEGASIENIAKEFGVGYKPIRRLFEEHKIGRFGRVQYLVRQKGKDSTFTEEGSNLIRKMIAEEKTIAEIQEVMEIDAKVIARQIKTLGLEPIGRRIDFSEEQLDKVRKMNADGATEQEIAAQLGVSRVVVKRLYAELGLKGHMNGKIRRDPEMSAEVLKLFNNGLRSCQIGEKLDLSPSSVQLFLKLQGIDISRALTDQEKERILELRAQGNGSRAISQAIGRDRGAVRNYLQEIGFKGTQPPPKPPQPEPTHKTCALCGMSCPIDNFKKVWKTMADTTRSFTRHNHCRTCHNLRKAVSGSINDGLKRWETTKNGQSCLQYLPYTILDLKLHLEALFEPWMTWGNWGRYNRATWADADQSTWKWQIDHIIPHSTFKYTSMDCEEFRACWALSNLRPYSAKQNVIDNDRESDIDDIENEATEEEPVEDNEETAETEAATEATKAA